MIDNKVWYYKALDFPELPEHLKQKFDLLIEQHLLETPEVLYTKEHLNEYNYINYLKSPPTHMSDGVEVPGGEMIYNELTPEFVEWFRHHVSATASLPRFAAHRTSAPLTFLAAHCDMRRNYALNYVHCPGGDNVKTVFFQEEGEPIIRGVGITANIKKPLHRIAEIVIPVNTWHLLRTDIIHSVENMTSPRIRITSDPDQAEIDAFEPHVIDTLK
jgi:hypothetical protein